MKKIFFVLAGLICFSIAASAQDRIKILIDPGHGGSDFGAKTQAGDKESDIVLDMAFTLADVAKSNNMDPIMTRTKKNQFLTHQARAGYKAEKGIKIFFVSLHLDHDKNPAQKGAKIYYSTMSKYGVESRVFAEKIGKGIEKLNHVEVKMEDKNAPVLSKNEMPAIILYYGFLTNADELKRAKDKAYQKELAQMIIKTIQGM